VGGLLRPRAVVSGKWLATRVGRPGSPARSGWRAWSPGTEATAW